MKQATYNGQQVFVGMNCDGRAAGMGHAYGREYRGMLDELRLYSRALSPEEVGALYDVEN